MSISLEIRDSFVLACTCACLCDLKGLYKSSYKTNKTRNTMYTFENPIKSCQPLQKTSQIPN